MGKGIARVADEQNRVALAQTERKAFGLASVAELEDREARRGGGAFVVLKFYRSSFECFSSWVGDELRLFSAFIQKLSSMDWNTIQTAGGFQRKALDLAKIDATAADHLKAVQQQLSEDISFFELRVDQKLRVHGFRAKDGFFLVLLDREHRVCKE